MKLVSALVLLAAWLLANPSWAQEESPPPTAAEPVTMPFTAPPQPPATAVPVPTQAAAAEPAPAAISGTPAGHSFFDGSVPPAPPRRGLHEHDGFYWRFLGPSIGFGSVSARVPALRPSRTLRRGLAAALTGDLGGAVETNWIVFARSSLGLSIGDLQNGSAQGLGGMVYGFFGVGVMHFVMPINLYFGTALGVAQGTLSFNDDDDSLDFVDEYVEAKTDLGVGLDLDAGKEWWVDDDLGIDLGLRFRFMTLPPGQLNDEPFADGSESSAVLAWSLSLAASVTYN